MNKETFIKGIVGMVVNCGVPLSFFESSSFRLINGQLAEKLDVGISRDCVRKMIMSEFEKQKNKLVEDIRHKLIFVKMDAATRHRVNYFAINIRYVDNENNSVTKTLAVRDTKNSHTSEFISDLLCKVLHDYNIEIENVVTIVTDNASNMISAVKSIENHMQPVEIEDEEENEDDFEDDNSFEQVRQVFNRITIKFA